jgi:hypothetical protein
MISSKNLPLSGCNIFLIDFDETQKQNEEKIESLGAMKKIEFNNKITHIVVKKETELIQRYYYNSKRI